MYEVSDRNSGISKKSTRNPRGKYNDKWEKMTKKNVSEYTV